jgi:hypothetical protein
MFRRPAGPHAFITEFHYDEERNAENQWVEFVVPVNFDLDRVALSFYTLAGPRGQANVEVRMNRLLGSTVVFDNLTPDGNWRIVVVNPNGNIQNSNGGLDGVALVVSCKDDPTKFVTTDFICYGIEDTNSDLTAANGLAEGTSGAGGCCLWCCRVPVRRA